MTNEELNRIIRNLNRPQRESLERYLLYQTYPDLDNDSDIVAKKEESYRLYSSNISKLIAKVEVYAHDLPIPIFGIIENIVKKIKVLQDIGLGYIKLGQPCSTLSGGENQRVKLATELAKRDTGKTLFILDEPTTGLHFADIRTLLTILNKLVDRGNTVLVIEHNLDVIRQADYVIDMGPEGGANGGLILSSGTPEDIASTESPTAPFLRSEGIKPTC